MINSFYTAATGAIQLKYGVDIVANNVANLNNNGYKASDASFADLIYTNIRDAADVDSVLKNGHGTKLSNTSTSFEQGPMNATGNMLDFAISGNGFFAVRSDDGTVRYTRTGSMRMTQGNDGNFYLTSSLGGLVLDADSNPIIVTDPETQSISPGVFEFANQDGLLRDGSNFFVESNTSGNAQISADADVKQGYLEGSSVDLASEMADLIEYQRAFDFSSKMVQISDEVMQTVNNLR
ncbi:MAG: flagellar hook-basal body protein [Anaerofustis sp.]